MIPANQTDFFDFVNSFESMNIALKRKHILAVVRQVLMNRDTNTVQVSSQTERGELTGLLSGINPGRRDLDDYEYEAHGSQERQTQQRV